MTKTDVVWDYQAAKHQYSLPLTVVDGKIWKRKRRALSAFLRPLNTWKDIWSVLCPFERAHKMRPSSLVLKSCLLSTYQEFLYNAGFSHWGSISGWGTRDQILDQVWGSLVWYDGRILNSWRLEILGGKQGKIATILKLGKSDFSRELCIQKMQREFSRQVWSRSDFSFRNRQM